MSKQEPVAAVQEGNVSWYRAIPKNGTLLYTHPAPSWQGLSDDEIEDVWNRNWDIGYKACARAIETILKEKNGR